MKSKKIITMSFILLSNMSNAMVTISNQTGYDINARAIMGDAGHSAIEAVKSSHSLLGLMFGHLPFDVQDAFAPMPDILISNSAEHAFREQGIQRIHITVPLGGLYPPLVTDLLVTQGNTYVCTTDENSTEVICQQVGKGGKIKAKILAGVNKLVKKLNSKSKNNVS